MFITKSHLNQQMQALAKVFTSSLQSIEKRIMSQVEDFQAAEAAEHQAVLTVVQGVQTAVTQIAANVAALAAAQAGGDAVALAVATAQIQSDTAALQAASTALSGAFKPVEAATTTATDTPAAA
jgi:hypothetical protein